MISDTECGIWDREGSCLIPLALLEALPEYLRQKITSDHLDIMGHMNIRWYFELFATSGRKFLISHGLNEDYFRGGDCGVFALKHFIQYFAEVREGQTVAVHTRLIGRSDFQNPVTDALGGLLDVLHLLAHPRARRLVAALGFVDVRFDFGDQRFQIFVLLHLYNPP